MELIKISTSFGGRQILSARELYIKLNLSMPHWSKWSLLNIVNNEYMIENKDWTPYTLQVNGNTVKDYYITIDFAKRIIAKSKTPIGEKYLTYLIEFEKDTNKPIQIAPKTRLELARENVLLLEEIESKDALILQQTPKAEFYDAVTQSNSEISISEASKLLGLGYGSVTLFKKLREKGVIMKGSRTPYQQYIDNGWFRVVQTKYTSSTFEVKISLKTVVYQRGLDSIRKLLSK